MMKNSFVLAILLAVSLPLGAVEVAVLKIGDAAPDFALPGVDGKTHRLADFAQDEVLMVVFTCNHCPTAQYYEDRIIAIAKDYAPRGVTTIAISPNDPRGVRLDELGYTEMSDTLEEMKVRAKDKAFPFPYLYDGDAQAVSRAYGPTATPQIFLFDKARKLRYKGRVDDSKDPAKVTVRDVRDALDAMLAGKPVASAETKAFGCSIKWSDKRGLVQASLERWANEEVSLSDIGLEGVKALVANDTEKIRLVNFWATWCLPCVQEFPDLVSIHRMYRKRPFELVTISVDDASARANALAFLEKQQASTTNYLHGADGIYELFPAVDAEWDGSIPFTMLIAPGGEVLYKHAGIIDPDVVKRSIVGHLGRFK